LETYDIKDRYKKYPLYDETRKCAGEDIEIFYYAESDKNRQSDYMVKMETKARNICGGCPFIEACADYAIKYEEYGFWGGLPAEARKLIRNKKEIKIVTTTKNRTVGY